jgi:SPP1 gp7 family putative phage head morphogenesis protein
MAFAEWEGGDGKDVPYQFISLGLSQKDAQMLATQQSKVQRVCMGLGVPMSMLDASNRTFNNGGLEAQNFWENTILPMLADLEDEINRILSPRLGVEVAKFDTRHVKALEAPAKFATINVGDAVDRKILLPEEARTELGLAAYSPEQLAKIQASQVGTSMTEQAALATALAAAASANPELLPWIATILGLPTPPAIETPAPPVLQLAPGAITKKPNLASEDLSTTWTKSLSTIRELSHEATRAERRAAIWRAQEAQTRAAEGAWVKATKKLFARQKKQTLDRLESRGPRWAKRDEADVNPDDVFDPTYQQEQTQNALEGLFETLMGASGARVAAQHGFGFNVNDPKVQALIDQRVSKLAEQITGTTYDAIKSVILTGIANGSPIPTIASGIEAVFEQADSTRAMLIARTETIAASADGALAAYQQAVDVGALDGYGKTWIAELDDRTDEVCADLDGETVPFDEPFSSGDDAPPNHPDCRCAIGAEPLDPTDRSIHADDVRSILHAIADGSLRMADLVA